MMDTVWAILVGLAGAWVLAFLCWEFYALATKREPLTWWIRRKLGIDPVKPRHVWTAPLFAFIFFGFAVWFVPHIEKWLPW